MIITNSGEKAEKSSRDAYFIGSLAAAIFFNSSCGSQKSTNIFFVHSIMKTSAHGQFLTKCWLWSHTFDTSFGLLFHGPG